MIRIIESKDNRSFLKEMTRRNRKVGREIEITVEKILDDVQERGDQAVRDYCQQFDGVNLDWLEVTEDEIKTAERRIEPALQKTIAKAARNIRDYHQRQLRRTHLYEKEDGVTLGQLIRPLSRVGIYVPGGKANYPSTVLMNAIPAKIAGVEEIVMVTPPDRDGNISDAILVAAREAGVDRIFKIGGAQAIGALAYGTESIPQVEKITGPGNIYVATAKRLVSGMVGIDMIAGPSEVLIVADERANPRYIAADMISQAEHDEMAAAVLVTPSRSLAEAVDIELERQVALLSRSEILQSSLVHYGAAILAEDLEECYLVANAIAPEHCELLVENPNEAYQKIRNAGAIFVGESSPEPVGDYFAGPNHTLPTSSTARFSSPLSVDDFIKKTSLICYSREALERDRDDIIRFAECEGLTGHANAIRIRFEMPIKKEEI